MKSYPPKDEFSTGGQEVLCLFSTVSFSLASNACFYMEIYKHFTGVNFISDGKNWPKCIVKCSSIATQKLNCPFPVHILNNRRQSPLMIQNNRHEYELDQRQNSLCSNSRGLYVYKVWTWQYSAAWESSRDFTKFKYKMVSGLGVKELVISFNQIIILEVQYS